MLAILRAIHAFVPGSTRSVGLIFLLSIITAVGEAAVLVVMVRMATALAAGEDVVTVSIGPLNSGDLRLEVVALIGLCLLLTLLTATTLNAIFSSRLSARVVGRSRSELVHAYLAATWSVQSGERPGRIQELVAGHAQRLAAASNVFTTALTAAFNAAFLVLTAFLISPTLAILMSLGAISLFIVLRPVRLAVKRASRTQARLASALSASTGELTHNARDIKVSAAMTRTYFLSRVAPGVYQYAAFGIVLVGLAVIARLDSADIGNLGAIIILLIRALSYSQRLSTAMQSAIEAEPYVLEIRSELARFEAGALIDGGQPLPAVKSLALRKVDFAYGSGPRVLKSVSFDVAQGEVVGIVGPSGGGKSTLVQLLLRLYSPQAGEYLVNDRPAMGYAGADWARQFALVPQDNRLIRASVAENISFYRSLSARAATAAQQAHVENEILTLPDGFNTLIGAGALDLSGGQRQRLGLARALVGAPGVLVLDEPTSALDSASEVLVQETLQEIRGRVTLIIVAHRISTLDICDKILVLDKGEVQAFGTPEDVRRSNAFFAEASQRSRAASSKSI